MTLTASITLDGKGFGILEIEAPKTDITVQPEHIHIVIDTSASMEERCGDGNKKLDQIKHVAKNILRYLANNCPSKNVSVSITTFNTIVTELFKNVIATESNLGELIDIINRVHAESETNIERALNHMSRDKTTNIFMSDGDANKGETRPSELAKLVDPNVSNTFVGFGLRHNAQIFDALGSVKGGKYYFIDNIEKSGLAYGNILADILFTSVREIRINVQNGKIYDWKTNEWTTDLEIGDMSSEMKKTFQLSRATVESQDTSFEPIVSIVSAESAIQATTFNDPTDLTKYKYRLRTQEFLYKAKQDGTPELRTQIAEFTNEMKSYMHENELTDDLLMKNLCDDMVIVYRTLGTRVGFMYSNARQTSQGTERAFNVYSTPSRCVGEDMNDHDVSDDSPYNTVNTQALMREISVPSERDKGSERSQGGDHRSQPSPFPDLDDLDDAAEFLDTNGSFFTRSPSI
jgi:hypothetical protein